MKRTLLLPLLTISALVSQGWAQSWPTCGTGCKVIADFEEGSATAFTNFSFGYAGDKGSATYTANGTDGVEDGHFSFSFTMPASAGNDDIVIYQINVSTNNEEGTALKPSPEFPITECTRGFSYKYNGAAHRLITELSTVTDYDHYATLTQPSRSVWTTVNVGQSQLEQAGWGAAKLFDLSKIEVLKWSIDKNVTSYATSGTLDIDDIHCLTDGNGGGGDGDSYYIFSNSNETAWDTYVMGYDWGEVTVSNPPNQYSPGPDYFDAVDKVAKIINASVSANSGVFIGVENGNSDKTVEDCTNGFSYWYKGGAHIFTLEFDKTLCTATGDAAWGNKWTKNQTASTSWQKVTAVPNQFTTPAEGGCTNNSIVNLSQVEKLAWGTETVGSGYNLMIANVACLAGSAMSPDPAPSANIGFAWGSTATSSSGNGGNSSGSGDGSSSSGGSGTSSSSDDGLDPIISYSNVPITGLNVVSFANSLQIASGKDAAVSLFNLRGEQVLSQKVLSGTTTISLKSQKQGFYYAVVKAGSQKKVVKVVLK